MSRCRSCGHPLEEVFADLGSAPLSNAYLSAADLLCGETHYPLRVWVCSTCLLVQLDEFEKPERIFSDYAYFSSYSDSWLEHSRQYVDTALSRYALDAQSLVAEVASNDGYLLQYFVQRGIPVLGIEPAENVAEVARNRGIRTEAVFFGEATANKLRGQYGSADLIAANNVLAHVPDIHDFVEGFRIMMADGGRASFEFPHLLELIRHGQFDTIYHEHFSYLSLLALQSVFEAHGLAMTEVEKLPTHGGSLRVWVTHRESGAQISSAVETLLTEERAAGLDRVPTYRQFGERIVEIKRQFLTFLLQAQKEGKRVAAYGAAAKGNTLLNYCGVRADLVSYVADRNPHKQGHYMPGSRIPIYSPDHIIGTRPDYLVILPWNIADEVKQQMQSVREWGCRFVTAVPELRID